MAFTDITLLRPINSDIRHHPFNSTSRRPCTMTRQQQQRPQRENMLLWSIQVLLQMSLLHLLTGCRARSAPFGVATSLASRRYPLFQQANPVPRILDLRGGASRKQSSARKTSLSSTAKTATGNKKVGGGAAAEKKSAFQDTLQKYKKILPLTRMYITMVAAATLLGVVLGEERTQELLALDPIRLFYGWELWRPLTAASFLGPPSIGWLMSGYYLFEYGSSLERAYGTAQHVIFLLTQLVMLTVLSVLVGQPFFAPSMITAMLHVLSRAMPHQKVKWLVFTVPYWSLPYGLMATDVLQAQSAMAAIPHALGILSGHFYHFHKFIWPKMGGSNQDWLAAPDFLVRRLDPNAKVNINNANEREEQQLQQAAKARKRSKGRKLGGS